MERGPEWGGAADAWFKVFAAIALGYIILAQAVSLLKSLGEITVIAVGGILVAYFVYPAIAWLNRRLPLWASLSIVYLSALLAVAAIFYILVPPALAQIKGLVHDWPTIERSVRGYAESPRNPFFAHLPAYAQQWMTKVPNQVSSDLQRNAVELHNQDRQRAGTEFWDGRCCNSDSRRLDLHAGRVVGHQALFRGKFQAAIAAKGRHHPAGPRSCYWWIHSGGRSS